MARPERFELPTPWFVAKYSIQLSYGRTETAKLYTANPEGFLPAHLAQFGKTPGLSKIGGDEVLFRPLRRASFPCPLNSLPSHPFTIFHRHSFSAILRPVLRCWLVWRTFRDSYLPLSAFHGGGNMRQIQKLTPEFVASADKPGMYPDGLGLYLQVSVWQTKSWLFRYQRFNRLRSLGLGACHTITLLEARKRAKQARMMLLDGIDPIDAKHERRDTAKAAQARVMTFDQCAAAYIEAHRHGWKNAKHAEQWTATLATYASPVFGKLPVAEVDTALVMKALQPIWTTKTETASRVRGRVESVLGWATVSGYRSGDNPARWKDHLQNLLAKRSKVAKVEHHPALPYQQMGEFMAELRTQGSMAALALEFTILTAARTGEVIGARWNEMDMDAKTWTIPAERMKAEREHRIPLCGRAIKILKELQPLGSEFVFPGLKGKPISNMAMLKLLQRMGRVDLTVHGFRSSFRDWAAEQTAYPHEMAEMALAHAIANKAEAAYRRGDLFAKRLRMMQDWQRHCDAIPGKGGVVSIKGRA